MKCIFLLALFSLAALGQTICTVEDRLYRADGTALEGVIELRSPDGSVETVEMRNGLVRVGLERDTVYAVTVMRSDGWYHFERWEARECRASGLELKDVRKVDRPRAVLRPPGAAVVVVVKDGKE